MAMSYSTLSGPKGASGSVATWVVCSNEEFPNTHNQLTNHDYC
jgi:hypothetical protein